MSYIGHDYSHYLARLYIGTDHFWKNGFSIPHFTPYLCGGIPLFADPQSIYFSLEQWLAFFLPALTATRLMTAVFVLLGYGGFEKLLKEIFAVRNSVAILGAVAFALNGFSFENLYVGHITHAAFFLAPWLLYAFFSLARAVDGRHYWKSVLLMALVLIYTFYSGGFHVLVVFTAMVFLVFPWNAAEAKRRGKRRALFNGCGVAALLFVIATSGQWVASLLYSSSFHRESLDSSGAPLFSLLARYLWFSPASTPLGILFGQKMYGAWEYVAFITKWTVPLVCVFLGMVMRQWAFFRREILLSFAAIFVVLVAASGSRLNHHLPFFHSYHNPLKLLGAFIPIVILISAIALDRMCPVLARRASMHNGILEWLSGAGVFLLILEFAVYAAYFRAHPAAATMPLLRTASEQLDRSKRLPPVKAVIRADWPDLGVALSGQTNIDSYEPLFGYRHENVMSKLSPGSAWAMAGGYYNLNHPGCFLYRRFLRCAPWDRIPASKSAEMARFSAGYEVEEWVPLWHRLLIRLSGLTVFVTIAGFGLTFLEWKRERAWILTEETV